MAKRITHASTAGERHPQPGMYLPDQTDDDNTEFSMDSPMSEDFGGVNAMIEINFTPLQHNHFNLWESIERPSTPHQLYPIGVLCTLEECRLMVSLLQSQQGVLNDLLKGQQALQTKTADLEKRFIELESKQASASLSSSGSEKECGKRNSR